MICQLKTVMLLIPLRFVDRMKAVSAKLEKAMDTQLSKMQQLVACKYIVFFV